MATDRPRLPPVYAGPLFLRLEEQGTSIERQGQSSTECKTSPTKVSCK